MVTSANSTSLGKWAIKELGEAKIYQHLLIEACQEFKFSNSPKINIIPDTGRFSRQARSEIQRNVEERIAIHCGKPTNVFFDDSRAHDGIQLADIVGNTIYQLCGAGVNDFANHKLLTKLASTNRLIIKPTDFNGTKPNWL